MRRSWKAAVLCLSLTSCGAEVAALALGVGLGLGTAWLYDEYYDDCHDDHYHDHYHDDCYYYAHVGWAPATVATQSVDGSTDLLVGDAQRSVVWRVRRGATGFEAPEEVATLDGLPTQLVSLDGDGDDAWVLDGATGAIQRISVRTMPTSLGTLCDGTETPARSFARAQIDGDGLCDAVMVDTSGAAHVALGTPTGELRVLPGPDPTADFMRGADPGRTADLHVALGEFDELPGTDLLAVDGASARVAIMSGRGNGTFGPAKIATFTSLGEILSVALVTLVPGTPPQLAVLFGDSADPTCATSTLVVVRTADGSLAVAAQPIPGARSITAQEPVAGGPSILLVADPVHGTIRTLRLRAL